MMASACAASLHETVVGIVHETLVRIAGRELPVTLTKETSNNSDDHCDTNTNSNSNNDPVVVLAAAAIIQQWRDCELSQLARRTVTVRSIPHVLQQQQQQTQQSLNKLYNVEIRTPTAFFQRYKEQQQQQNTSSGTTSTSTLTMISAMGVMRTVHSAYELATEHFLPVLELALAQHQQSQGGDSAVGVATHWRVAPHSGFICVATHDLLDQFLQQQQQNSGVWHACPYCPLWFKSNDVNNNNNNKGLWWHLQLQHEQQHHHATETATGLQQRDQTAIVVYNPQTSTATPTRRKTLPDPTTTTALPLPSSVVTTQMDSTNAAIAIATKTTIDQRNMRENNNPLPEDPFQCVQRGGTVAELQIAMQLCVRPDASSSTTSFHCRTARDRHGAPLLLWAAGGGHLALVQFLVEQCGCHPDTTVQMGHRAFAGRTALHWAARNGHVSVVDYLLSSVSVSDLEDLDCNDITNTTTTTSVHGQQQRLEAITADGTTAFCWAAWQGHGPVLQLLHDKYGCRVDSCNKFGCTAVLWAAQGPVQIRMDHDNGIREWSSPRLVQWLEKVGCPTYTVNHSGHGVLHKAAQRGNRRLCEWFVSQRLFPWLQMQQRVEGPAETDEEKKNSPNDSELVNVFRLVGPDNEECTPSDLAGMEGHQELALYLAQQEMALVVNAFGGTQLLLSPLVLRPQWLSLSDCNFAAPIATKNFAWEPTGGIFRMRSALPRR